MHINAGELNKNVILQYQSITQNGYGEQDITWTDLDFVWAKIEPLTGREYFAAQQLHAEAKIKLTIRYRTGINPAMRFKYGNRAFNIVSIQNVNQANTALEIACWEVVL